MVMCILYPGNTFVSEKYHVPNEDFLIKNFNNLKNNYNEMFTKNTFDFCGNYRICFNPGL